ncbi:MAG: hypothetical protein GIKADHBN_03524 [Phycisphaerales bacterium]|nr:hypothetical protein [Phycisphaerales bacterium]
MGVLFTGGFAGAIQKPGYPPAAWKLALVCRDPLWFSTESMYTSPLAWCSSPTIARKYASVPNAVCDPGLPRSKRSHTSYPVLLVLAFPGGGIHVAAYPAMKKSGALRSTSCHLASNHCRITGLSLARARGVAEPAAAMMATAASTAGRPKADQERGACDISKASSE